MTETTTEFGPRKTAIIIAIVAGCFAMLWPKILYPMLTGSVNPPHSADSSGTIRQERQTPPHAGSYHPALRERGRAIPSSHIVPRIQDRPDHIAPMKMRPPMGGAGHVVAAPKGNGSLGLLMPLYTIGIIIFFLYTISKVLRKTADSEIMRPEYSTAAAEREYQKLVFNPEVFAAAVTAVNGQPEQRERPTTPIEEPPPTIDELQELDQAPKSNGLAAGLSPNSKVQDDQDENELEEFHEASPTVKVLNMEMTTSCEGRQKCSRPTTPVLFTSHGHTEEKEEKSPPISIYLEGSLPPQCELLVTDSKTQEIQEEENVEVPVVLSGKMTLSLISLDQVAAVRKY
ncbi:resistance to inhibitors of cholinesterase protein 3 isoform X9 [Nasonia vitripennis]|uniref:Resistance to inhibitors of cholinesterase protein 3 N-terminal domain-containing protein n=1 Tax=Nasonia vitripennis TaxID=7425 RepID=A0A7M7QTE2_NASVI|nr:resistance to inhibitors of cholinesterase protein 3 isoform X9 [Nasonia vitripennis]